MQPEGRHKDRPSRWQTATEQDHRPSYVSSNPQAATAKLQKMHVRNVLKKKTFTWGINSSIAELREDTTETPQELKKKPESGGGRGAE